MEEDDDKLPKEHPEHPEHPPAPQPGGPKPQPQGDVPGPGKTEENEDDQGG